ncbi:hypothetical protein QTG54_015174 [Skeletonema marinoi]|uniref:Ankyrin repeat protein n=1 Tax=Skeletonema marinoi TaxID=267567 RepID=A0AAD9D4W5_9STRA|nr:hypothetical protein QTG54_015174 [Skeletonema marinoi]
MSESDNNSHRSAESLLTSELFDFCSSDSLSEDGLREIIERYGLNDDRHGSDYDFFLEVCANERVTEGIIQCLLEYFPAAASTINDNGLVPLHLVCNNKNVTLNIVQLLIDAAPDSVRKEIGDGWMPLHCLCRNVDVDKTIAIEILRLLIEKCPEAIRHAENDGFLPIHMGAYYSDPQFCRVLIEAYPGSESERTRDNSGALPFHFACTSNTVATVEYLYKLYPDAINHATAQGIYPIHYAIIGLRHRENPIAAVDIVQFLLGCDPTVKLQKFRGLQSLLHVACKREYTDSNIQAGIQVIKVVYDAHPEAIEENEFASEIQRYHQQVQAFINAQLVYSRQAKDHRLMMTPDGNGQLPLHTALQNNVRLGSIKLLVKGNPSAIRNFDNSGVIPLHMACQHHDSACVVQYLLDLDRRTLRVVDFDNNTALHYACRGAKDESIALLLEKYDAVSVSKRNAHKKLPIDLLWESNEVQDRESVEYTESVFRLLKAYPETVIDCIVNMKQQIKSEDCPSQNGKKRKYGNA